MSSARSSGVGSRPYDMLGHPSIDRPSALTSRKNLASTLGLSFFLNLITLHSTALP